MTSAAKPSIAVVGPGAVGGTVAAWLSRSSRVGSVILCARTSLDRLVVEAPDGRLIEASPRVVTDPAEITEPVDWILVATKAYDVAAASRWLTPLMGSAAHVAVLQNGVEHVERFAPFVAVERIVPVVVDIPAERSAPPASSSIVATGRSPSRREQPAKHSPPCSPTASSTPRRPTISSPSPGPSCR